MLPGVRRAAALTCVCVVSGCGLGLSGLQASSVDTSDDDAASADSDSGSGGDDASRPPPPGHPDAGRVAARDASTDAGPTAPTTPNACTNSSGPCVVVPSGWSLVAFAPAQTSACPAGFDSSPAEDLVEGPTATGGCSCGTCSVTQPPSCAAGSIAVMYDTDGSGTCNKVAMPSPLGNSPAGSCGTDIYQGDYSIYDIQYTAPAPSGGTCAAPGVKDTGALTYTSQDRVCQANDAHAAGCDGGVCRPDISAPYAACIAAPGDVACPSGPLSVAHAIGASGSFSCADCACTMSGTCSGTLTLYTDATCTTGPYAISTDVCVGISSAATYRAYRYSGGTAKGVTCEDAAPGPAQNIALTDPQTVCCAK